MGGLLEKPQWEGWAPSVRREDEGNLPDLRPRAVRQPAAMDLPHGGQAQPPGSTRSSRASRPSPSSACRSCCWRRTASSSALQACTEGTTKSPARMRGPEMGLWTFLTCPTRGTLPSFRRTSLILGTNTGRTKMSTAWSLTAAMLQRELPAAQGDAGAVLHCVWLMPTMKQFAKCHERWPGASPAGCPADGQ